MSDCDEFIKNYSVETENGFNNASVQALAVRLTFEAAKEVVNKAYPKRVEVYSKGWGELQATVTYMRRK